MNHIPFIYSLIEWERSLEFKEERRKNHRFEPYVNYLAAPDSRRNITVKKPHNNPAEMQPEFFLWNGRP